MKAAAKGMSKQRVDLNMCMASWREQLPVLYEIALEHHVALLQCTLQHLVFT
jgi:hypothetical protein